MLASDDVETIRDGEREKVTALLKVSEALSVVLDFDSVLSCVTEQSRALLKADRCTLFLLEKGHDGAGDELVCQTMGAAGRPAPRKRPTLREHGAEELRRMGAPCAVDSPPYLYTL